VVDRVEARQHEAVRPKAFWLAGGKIDLASNQQFVQGATLMAAMGYFLYFLCPSMGSIAVTAECPPAIRLERSRST
jgi:hypothetical protein